MRVNANGQEQGGRPRTSISLIVAVTLLFIIDVVHFTRPIDYAAAAAKSRSTAPIKSTSIPKKYVASKIERFYLENGRNLGLDSDPETSSGCTEWKNPNSPIAAELQAYQDGIEAYKVALASFLEKPRIKDLRKEIEAKGDYSVCDSLELHPDGLNGLFPLNVLTQTASGLLEPLFPPMRSPRICWDFGRALMSMEYLVHDFAAYCRKLTPRSRIVLVDMGASLSFHGDVDQPAVYLTDIYTKFGFHFDHIYAYEITPTTPADMVEKVPDWMAAAYHWINVGVSPDLNSKHNPWRMLLQEYDENDFGEYKKDVGTNECIHRIAPSYMDLLHTLFRPNQSLSSWILTLPTSNFLWSSNSLKRPNYSD